MMHKDESRQRCDDLTVAGSELEDSAANSHLAGPMPSSTTYSFGPFTLDLMRASVLREGEEVKLRPKSFELLAYLVQNPGRLIPKDELMKAVWPDAFVSDDSIVQCVKDIRRALQDES